MHICIPDTREMRPAHGSAYLLYNVHIDGLYHCSLRYKQLLHLHQALSRKFSRGQHQLLASFPPKKLLPLSASQTEDRRQQLEKYLQTISQDKAIANSSIFNLFLLEAQRESTRIEERHVHLDIELVNGQKIRLPLITHDSADAVLTAVCRALGLNDRHHAYFCLCLCGYDVVRDKLIIKRRLSFFEAPFITLQMAIQQQEQLQSVLTAAYQSSRQTGALQAANSNNNLELTCNCLTCTQIGTGNVGATSGPVSNSAATTGVPYAATNGSPTNLVNGAPCNGGQNNNNINYYRTTATSDEWSAAAAAAAAAVTGNSTPPRRRTSFTTANTNQPLGQRSFVTHRILLRKSYWDPIYDSYILNDQQALNLLFIQTVYDMKHSLMFVNRDTYQQLEALLANDSKLDYILLARTLKYYNYVHFEPCYSDYPRPRTKVMISIGSKELNMRVLKTPRSSAAMSRQNQYQHQTSSSSSSSSSYLPSTPPEALTPEQQQQQQQQQQRHPVLYCTSSLVPSGFRDLITKDELIEEEYNFKVPLIRCWRLTSLETLNSNGNQQQQQQQQATGSSKPSALAGGKRKSFSLFNSVVGNQTGNGNTNPPTGSTRANGCNLVSSGSGGHSLVSTLINASERNNNNNNNSNGLAPNHSSLGHGQHSFSRFSSNSNGSSSSGNSHQAPGACSHENGCHCRRQSSIGNNSADLLGGDIDQAQLSQYELSFEYLVAKDRLKWITISSDQAIFISISLQGVVDELVSKRDCAGAASHEFEFASHSSSNLYSADHQPQSSSPPAPPPLLSLTPSSTPSGASVNASTPPISIKSGGSGSRNASALSNQLRKLSESFTYMYRDGAQKLLKTHSIDRFCATLIGGVTLSGSHHPRNGVASYSASSRRRAANHGSVTMASGAASALPQSAPSSNSRLANAAQASFWSFDSVRGGLATSPTSYLFGYGHAAASQQTSFETVSGQVMKKAPSPIINDAFEGVVTHDDDM